MANRKVFSVSAPVSKSKVPDAVNASGGTAYKNPAKVALASYVMTGTFGDSSIYGSGHDQNKAILDLLDQVDPVFAAKAAIYSAEKGKMKDVPSLILAAMAAKGIDAFNPLFDRIVVNGKDIKNFAQIAKSGSAGREVSLSSRRVKRAIQKWFDNRKPGFLKRDDIGGAVRLKNIIREAHVRPKTNAHKAAFCKILKKDVPSDLKRYIPQEFRALDAINKGGATITEVISSGDTKIDFRQIDHTNRSTSEWVAIAKTMTAYQVLQNLATLERHGALNDETVVDYVCRVLTDRTQVVESKLVPYKVYTAWKHSKVTNNKIREAIRDCLDLSTENAPVFDGGVSIAIDVSGSMSDPVTGYRGGETSKLSCLEAASLFAAVIRNKNPNTTVVLFDTDVRMVIQPWEKKMGVIEFIEFVKSNSGGGTACAYGVSALNKANVTSKNVVFFSDNESWADYAVNKTGLQTEWDKYAKRVHGSRMVLCDLKPSNTVQVKGNNVMLVGGFSEAVFDVMANFSEGEIKSFVDIIEEVDFSY